MRHKKEDYTCCRCGYKTPRKDRMYRHLYKLNKPCPGVLNSIELTEEINQHILANRVYIIQQVIQQPQQIIYNYNQIINIISNISPIDKIQTFFNYNNITPRNFEDMIEYRYERDISRLENDSYRIPRQLKTDDFYDIVDDLTFLSLSTNNNIENLNTVYDDKTNRLNIYSEGEWQSCLLDKGVKKIIENIKIYYLDIYEVYSIRKIKCGSLYYEDKNQLKEKLCEYYNFIACFELYPYVYQKNDNEILYPISDPRYDTPVNKGDLTFFKVADEFNSLYNQIKNELKVVDQNKMIKKVKDIIKYNSKSNISDLNKKVIELIQIDEEYKQELIKKL